MSKRKSNTKKSMLHAVTDDMIAALREDGFDVAVYDNGARLRHVDHAANETIDLGLHSDVGAAWRIAAAVKGMFPPPLEEPEPPSPPLPEMADQLSCLRLRVMQLMLEGARMEARALAAESKVASMRAEELDRKLRLEAQGVFASLSLNPQDAIDLDTGMITRRT